MALRRSVSLSVFILALSGCAGSEPHAVAASTAPAASSVTVPPPAQRVFLDPVTGEQRAPTAEELRQMRLQAPVVPDKSAETPRVVEYPNGTVGVFTKRPKNQVHVEEMKDGSLRSHCKDEPSSRKDQP